MFVTRRGSGEPVFVEASCRHDSHELSVQCVIYRYILGKGKVMRSDDTLYSIFLHEEPQC